MKLLNYVTILIERLIERKNDMNPKISIIVPVYNVEKYIHKCVDSILNQTFKDFELILIDDGSTDSSGEICDEYGELDERVIVIHKENGGVSSARNLGIRLAKGEYIGFIDSDDDIEINMHNEFILKCENFKYDLVVCSFKIINTISKIIKNAEMLNIHVDYIKKKDIEKNILPKLLSQESCYGYGMYSVCNKIYKREFIVSNRLIFDEVRNHGEDLIFNINVITKVESMVLINKQLYNYYIRNRYSLSRKYDKSHYKYITSNHDFFIQLCDKYNFKDIIEKIDLAYISNTVSYMCNILKQGYSYKSSIIKNIIGDKKFINLIDKYSNHSKIYKLINVCIHMKFGEGYTIVLLEIFNLRNAIYRRISN
ncbi:glycosyltransferase family 2 protein [Clostridium sulfidigenes]|uniref:glycosyltransferase family 2 protein n=1 Tax=Clostridium sulfidigenes TaxID=318464 RepID=UPI003F8BA8C7